MCVSKPGQTSNISSLNAPQLLTIFPSFKPERELRNDLVNKLTDGSI